jgi:hypothetical protein
MSSKNEEGANSSDGNTVSIFEFWKLLEGW